MYPSFFHVGHLRKKLLLLGISVCSFLVGLLMVTEGGLYVFQLFDYYACSGMTLLVFAILQAVCVGWCYGAERLYVNIEDMIGYRPLAIHEVLLDVHHTGHMHTGLQEKTLSTIFEVSLSTVSRIILTWTSYLYQVLGSLPVWMTREQVQATMPDKFKLYCPQAPSPTWK
ncbi:sodium- and chloride-dependent GABA transporter 3-like [Coregonus clupeaformis]|uniref:sodium- and chloride-dependent GABA transporter 3-like n=1 Tax=Coregonus clupeaformis TaxID=59861 RepID=UPI001E1C4C40|nr:sodium- and chloride-dependent GABA transporter 3-like [Coregonus clupeaformis]